MSVQPACFYLQGVGGSIDLVGRWVVLRWPRGRLRRRWLAWIPACVRESDSDPPPPPPPRPTWPDTSAPYTTICSSRHMHPISMISAWSNSLFTIAHPHLRTPGLHLPGYDTHNLLSPQSWGGAHLLLNFYFLTCKKNHVIAWLRVLGEGDKG